MEMPPSLLRLDKATTVDEVVGHVRDYLAALSPGDLDRLPRYNRPVLLENAAAVDRWAQQLDRYEPPTNQDPANTALFAEVRRYFLRASARVAQLTPAA